MKTSLFLKSLIVTIVSLFGSIVVVFLVFNDEISMHSFVYAIVIVGGQSIIPFLLFTIVFKLLTYRLLSRNRRMSKIFSNLLVGVVVLVAVLVPFIVFDVIDENEKLRQDLLSYLKDFSLFIVYVAFLVVLDFVLALKSTN